MIREIFSEYGITCSDKQHEQFSRYAELLIRWNGRVNLTRITEPEEICRYHFVDSVMLLRHLLTDEISLIDIGTGAGFPGIPLKIMAPEMKLVLLDSLDKRCAFLREVVKCLALEDVTVIHGRAEDIASSKAGEGSLRGEFDIAVSRAVAKLGVLCEYAVPFLKTGGEFVAYKLSDIPEELSAASSAFDALGASLARTERYRLLDGEPERALFFIRKDKPTPDKYPRRAGVPERKPL